jgi:Subtilase family
MADGVLLFLTFKPNPPALAELREFFRSRREPKDLAALSETLKTQLRLSFKPPLRGMPSADFVLALDGVHETPPWTTDDTFVFALDTVDSKQAEELYDLVREPRKDLSVRDVQVAVDLPTGLSSVWCPQEATFPLFGDVRLALAQMRAKAAADNGAYGQDVNVVIIDQGINKDVLAKRFPGADFRGGWKTPEFGKGGPPGPPGPPKFIDPGAWPDDGLGSAVTHGTKMASLVLAVAPRARILDVALLPSHILNLRDTGTTTPGFLSWAAGAYWVLIAWIPWIRANFADYSGPWVLNNSWGVFDLTTDFPTGSFQNYGSNPNHPLNLAVATAPSIDIDVVFAVGNCGQFCPDPRCGAGQIGPGRSIHGVAAIKDVLTVSAVRGDEIWLGYSSQGPAVPTFYSTKPDLCAPSQFAGAGDWNRSFTGTSSACALTAGAIAAKRSLVLPSTLSPAQLRAYAVQQARRVGDQMAPDVRHGAGMIDVSKLLM